MIKPSTATIQYCFLTALTLLITSVCGHSQTNSIHDEIIAITEDYNRAWESLNTDSISKYHDDNITYYWRGTKGPFSKGDFESMLNELLPRMS